MSKYDVIQNYLEENPFYSHIGRLRILANLKKSSEKTDQIYAIIMKERESLKTIQQEFQVTNGTPSHAQNKELLKQLEDEHKKTQQYLEKLHQEEILEDDDVDYILLELETI